MKGRLPAVLVMVFVAAAAGLGAWAWKLSADNDGLRHDLDRTRARMEQFQKKFGEQKRMAGELLKLKAGIEGSIRSAQADTEREKQTLTAAVASVKAEAAGLRKKLEESTIDLERTRKELSVEKDGRQKSVQDLERLAALKKTVDERMKKTAEQLDACRTRNAELCIMANDLVEKYRNKGMMGVVAQKEPLTQIKKVELDKMTADYADRIRELKLRKTEAGSGR